MTSKAANTVNLNKHVCKATYARQAGSATRRRILFTVLALAALTGHSDGETYADCVACGQRAYLDRAISSSEAFQLGHVLADACNGTFCPCNLLPLCSTCNNEMGKETMTDVCMPHYDSRMYWDGALVRDPGVRRVSDNSRGRAAWKRPNASS